MRARALTDSEIAATPIEVFGVINNGIFVDATRNCSVVAGESAVVPTSSAALRSSASASESRAPAMGYPAWAKAAVAAMLRLEPARVSESMVAAASMLTVAKSLMVTVGLTSLVVIGGMVAIRRWRSRD